MSRTRTIRPSKPTDQVSPSRRNTLSLAVSVSGAVTGDISNRASRVGGRVSRSRRRAKAFECRVSREEFHDSGGLVPAGPMCLREAHAPDRTLVGRAHPAPVIDGGFEVGARGGDRPRPAAPVRVRGAPWPRAPDSRTLRRCARVPRLPIAPARPLQRRSRSRPGPPIAAPARAELGGSSFDGTLSGCSSASRINAAASGTFP